MGADLGRRHAMTLKEQQTAAASADHIKIA